MSNPILDPELRQSIEASIVMYRKRGIWKKWGLSQLREQGSAILFYGPSGTGKTITARWIARQLGLFIKEIQFSQIGSKEPGELARNVERLFNDAKLPDKNGKESIVFIDECDTILLARKNLGYDHRWMLEVINKALTEIRQYPGLVILATNQEPVLDEALEGRILAKFHFQAPKHKLTRIALWRQKWPRKLPVQPTEKFLEWATEFPLTGNEIETSIINFAGDALARDIDLYLSQFKINGEYFPLTQARGEEEQEILLHPMDSNVKP